MQIKVMELVKNEKIFKSHEDLNGNEIREYHYQPTEVEIDTNTVDFIFSNSCAVGIEKSLLHLTRKSFKDLKKALLKENLIGNKVRMF